MVDGAEGGIEVGGTVPEVLDLVDATAGGVSVGGTVPEVLDLVDATAGGVSVGGTVPEVLDLVDATAGGVAVGGEAGDDFEPPPTPGATCGAAGDVSVGVTFGANVGSIAVQQWWRLPTYTSGTVYRVTDTGLGGFGGATLSLFSGSCAGLNPITLDHSSAHCRDWTAPDNGPLWLEVIGPFSGSVTYTLLIEAAAC